MNKEKKKKKGKCCCKSGNILECLSAIDREINRVTDCIPHKQLSRSTKQKVLFCIVLRDIATLEKKLDKILCELTTDLWISDCDCDSHSKSHDHSDSDCDSSDHSDKHCKSDSDWD